MMNPWISTSLPLYDAMAWVTPKFALIESTSSANVSRGTSLPCATRRRSASAAQDRSTARTQRAHGRDLAPTCEGGAVHRDEHVEHDDDGHDRQDRGKRFLRHAKQIEDREQHRAR